jgi:hypothetical protein
MHEDLDDLFLESRFGNSDGNFYKGRIGIGSYCSRIYLCLLSGNVACLNYLGDDPEVYMNLSALGMPFIWMINVLIFR